MKIYEKLMSNKIFKYIFVFELRGRNAIIVPQRKYENILQELLQDISELIVNLYYYETIINNTKEKEIVIRSFYSKYPEFKELSIEDIMDGGDLLNFYFSLTDPINDLSKEYKEEELITYKFNKTIKNKFDLEKFIKNIVWITNEYSEEEITGISIGFKIKYNLSILQEELYSGSIKGNITINQDLKKEKLEILLENLKEMTDNIELLPKNEQIPAFEELARNYNPYIISLSLDMANDPQLIEKIEDLIKKI